MTQSPTDESEHDEAEMVRVLQVVSDLEETRTPAEPEVIAKATGLESQRIKELMARAYCLGLALYFPEVEQRPGLPIRSWCGWSVTLAGRRLLEGEDSKA